METQIKGKYIGLGYEMLTIEQIQYEIYSREPYDIVNSKPTRQQAYAKAVPNLIHYQAPNIGKHPRTKREPAYCKYCTTWLIERTENDPIDPCHECKIGYHDHSKEIFF